jgi:hypothetical protein
VVNVVNEEGEGVARQLDQIVVIDDAWNIALILATLLGSGARANRSSGDIV